MSERRDLWDALVEEYAEQHPDFELVVHPAEIDEAMAKAGGTALNLALIDNTLAESPKESEDGEIQVFGADDGDTED